MEDKLIILLLMMNYNELKQEKGKQINFKNLIKIFEN